MWIVRGMSAIYEECIRCVRVCGVYAIRDKCTPRVCGVYDDCTRRTVFSMALVFAVVPDVIECE